MKGDSDCTSATAHHTMGHCESGSSRVNTGLAIVIVLDSDILFLISTIFLEQAVVLRSNGSGMANICVIQWCLTFVPIKKSVERRWRPLVRAVIHGETFCPHVDNLWTERAIRLFVRRAIPQRYAVAAGPMLIKSQGGNFSFDICILKVGNPVAYIEPGSHQRAARYGGMSQRAANKSLAKIQRNDKRKKMGGKTKNPSVAIGDPKERLRFDFR